MLATRIQFECVRRSIAASICCFGLTVGLDARAQEPLDKFSKCDWIGEAAQGFGPDYSFVDSMQPDAALPGASKWGPICVSVEGSSLTWVEARPGLFPGPTDDILVSRRLFFWKPTNSRQLKLPLIIWAHPQGSTDIIDPLVTVQATENVALPALRRGYAFMSLQFRHPTVSQQYYGAPAAPPPPPPIVNGAEPPSALMRSSKDIATAIQWARHYADTLHIDKDNIFLVGQSRGSLAVLTALMADQARTPVGGDPPWVDESSLPQAVFAAQAQTTYRDTQLKNFFIKQYASASVTTSIVSQPIQFPRCRQDSVNLQGPFDYWCHYDLATQDFSNSVSTPLSSYDELDADDTRPIWIRYDRTPLTTATITKSGLYVNDPGTYQDNPNIDDNGANCFETTDPKEKVLKCFDVHHPNFGAQLRLKWQNLASPASHVIVQYAGTVNATQREEARLGFFDKYFCFFMQYQPAGGDVIETLDFDANEERKKSIIAENATREPDEQVPTAKCTLKESEAWTY